MASALIVGDVHLEKAVSASKPGIGGAFHSRVVDQLNLLDWILEQANDYHVADIIMTGDIFHNVKPDYSIVIAFLSFLQKADLAGIDVHIILGNHELKRTGNIYSSVLDLLQEISNVCVYKNIYTLHRDGVSFTFMPFRDRKSLGADTHKEAVEILNGKLPFESSEIPSENIKVLIGHLAIENSMPIGDEFDDELNEIMCPVSMFSEYDYVWMGHVHKPQVLNKQKPYVAHIGSLDISDFGETDHKKIIVLFDPELDCKFKHILVPSRQLKNINISVPENENSTDYIVSELTRINEETSLKDNLIKLEVKLLSPIAESIDRHKVQNLLQSFGIHHLSSFAQSKTAMILSEKKEPRANITIDPKNAVKIFAEKVKFESEEDKKMYIDLALQTIEELSLKIKK